jgi:hypothetical protein
MGYTTDEDREAFIAATSDNDDADSETPEAPPAEEDTPDEGDEGTDEPVVEDEESPEEQSEAPPDEPTFTVIVDGQQVEVPQSELLRGYSRHADYTRKVQMLAVQRRQLSDANELLLAMDRNPRETIAVLARHYGVNAEDNDDDYESNGNGQPRGPTPEQRQLQELLEWQRTELTRQREAAVDNELARLHQQYGEFDEDALFGFAVERDVRDLETALRAMQFGRIPSARTEKRKVAGMNGGASRSGAAVPKAPAEEISHFRDAYDAAKRELARG